MPEPGNTAIFLISFISLKYSLVRIIFVFSLFSTSFLKSAGDILLIMPLRHDPKLSTELANMDTSDIPNNSANVSALPSSHTS